MSKRKTVACIMVRPEEVYQQRVMDGLQAQCELYGYNLAIFSPLVDGSHFYKDYLKGEMNILNLPDLNSFDAVILVSIPLITLNVDTVLREVIAYIRKDTTVPVISLDYDIEGFEAVHTDDITAFYDITKHVLDIHGSKKIYMLTGHENNDISERRISGYRKAMEESGIRVMDGWIFYGDFWYTSGEALADRIISGEIELPEAIVCAGDHMAIGLTNRLIKNGIRVPEDVIVTGYEATVESVINDISITSYVPRIHDMAAEAVDRIRAITEPDKPLIKSSENKETGIFIGGSCGCSPDSRQQKNAIRASLYASNRNYGDNTVNNIDDMSNLFENYMLENLTTAESPLDCLKRIFGYTFLIEPFDHFYLCLRPDWLDTETRLTEGYPEVMRCVMHAMPEVSPERTEEKLHCRNDDGDNFNIRLMLPALWDEFSGPSVFYFAPCHFSDNTFGYSVVQCYLYRRFQLNAVFRNWQRNVNSALEMIRARNKLLSYSILDSMTKLNNRRGMSIRLKDLLSLSEPDNDVLAIVIDMDGLKQINDTYGHNEGDYAIMTIASVVRCITGGNEVSARAGGDEFYIIGVGNYSDEGAKEKISRFYTMLEEQSRISMKPYEMTASVGYSIMNVSEVTDMSSAIAVADSKMYTSKAERKKKMKTI